MVLRLYYAHLHINWHSPCLATFVENGKGMPTPSNKLFRVSTLSSHLLPLQEFESTIKKKKRAKFIISALQSSGNQWVSKFQHELSRIHQPFPSSSFSRNLPTTTRKEKKGTNGLSLSQRVLQPVRCNELSWLLWGHKCKYTELDTKSLAFFYWFYYCKNKPGHFNLLLLSWDSMVLTTIWEQNHNKKYQQTKLGCCWWLSFGREQIRVEWLTNIFSVSTMSKKNPLTWN